MLTTLLIIFVLAYAAIALEHYLHINKSASALIGAGLLWIIYALVTDSQQINQELSKNVDHFEFIIIQLEKLHQNYWDNEIKAKSLEEKLEGVEFDWKVKDLIEDYLNLLKKT